MSKINYSATTIFGAMTAELADMVIKSKDLAERIKAAMDATAGGGATPENLEGGDFGVATGEGSAFYTAVANLKANLDVISVSSLADIDMGG